MRRRLFGLAAMIRKAAIALALMATAVTAQDGSEGAAERTPEAAQAFLATHLLRGGWDAESFAWFNGSTYHSYKGGWRETPERIDGVMNQEPIYGEIVGVTAPDMCTTILTVAVKWKGRIFNEEGLIPIAPRQVTAVIDWRNVNPITVKPDSMVSRERGGARVTTTRHVFDIWNPKTKSGVIFKNGEKTVTDRAAFAMNFLREKCDPTAYAPF